MITLLSYLGAHWILFILVVAASIGLFYLTWVLKNIKYALYAIALIIAGFAYQSSNMDGYKRRVNEEKAQQIATLQARIETLQHVEDLDTQRALSDAQINTQLEKLSRATPFNNGPCLDIDAARRVRAITSVKPRSASITPGRPTSLLPRHSAAPE